MATTKAVHAVCDAVRRLLEQSWQPAMFGGTDLRFAVLSGAQFSTGLTAGVSVLLYRVDVDHQFRQPPAAPDQRPALPLELGLMLTAWGGTASLEQDILTWAMRVLADHPTLPAGVLNTARPRVFQPSESVEVVPGSISTEELFRLWDVLPGDLRLSVPYRARVVRIDSEVDAVDALPVLERVYEYAGLREPS